MKTTPRLLSSLSLDFMQLPLQVVIIASDKYVLRQCCANAIFEDCLHSCILTVLQQKRTLKRIGFYRVETFRIDEFRDLRHIQRYTECRTTIDALFTELCYHIVMLLIALKKAGRIAGQIVTLCILEQQCCTQLRIDKCLHRKKLIREAISDLPSNATLAVTDQTIAIRRVGNPDRATWLEYEKVDTRYIHQNRFRHGCVGMAVYPLSSLCLPYGNDIG